MLGVESGYYVVGTTTSHIRRFAWRLQAFKVLCISHEQLAEQLHRMKYNGQ